MNALPPGLAAAGTRLEDDAYFMSVALALGERHLGAAWPNPSVGALVVDPRGPEPVIVSRGVTQPGGRPHAERVALDAAGLRARGATLYVSLEPCSHFGKTPPCVDAIVAAGITRVVTALTDPDPRVSGRGHERLRAAGIEVRDGVLAGEAKRAHRGHILRVTTGRPAVTLKLARTSDGYAGVPGARLRITGEAADAATHLRRVHADAVLVGIETVLADDPLLTVRLPGLERRSPVRVVFDSHLRLPHACRLVAGAAEVPVWAVATLDAPVEAERALVERGVEVMRVDAGADGRVDLHAALRLLAERGITRILCEGGPSLAGALAEADLVDDLVIVTGAKPLGREGLTAITPALALARKRRLTLLDRRMAGEDRIDVYERTA